MIIVDTALKARAAGNRPVMIGLFGAGTVSKGLVHQVLRRMPGMRVALICNRTIANARHAYLAAGVAPADIAEVEGADAIADAIAAGKFVITSDYRGACAAPQLEVLIEATGHVEYGAHVTMAAIENRKPMVLMNAELDGTVGPLLKTYADAAGVIITGCDGDQPGAQMNLVRFVETMGLKPLLCGNIKGLQDHYRTPATQKAFAEQWGQSPYMVTSFADGTKISFEQALVANATGMQVAQRGMLGYEHRGHVDEMVGMYDVDRLRELGGIVDYALGAQPGPGVFVFAEAQDDVQKGVLHYMKMGEGPLYSFYTPYHITFMEVPISAARAALCNDVVIAPKGAPVVDVVAAAKRDLRAGETLDGIGGYMTYGMCENYAASRRERLLPIGLGEGAVLKRDIRKDELLTYGDVDLPPGGLIAQLRARQDDLFPVA